MIFLLSQKKQLVFVLIFQQIHIKKESTLCLSIQLLMSSFNMSVFHLRNNKKIKMKASRKFTLVFRIKCFRDMSAFIATGNIYGKIKINLSMKRIFLLFPV